MLISAFSSLTAVISLPLTPYQAFEFGANIEIPDLSSMLSKKEKAGMVNKLQDLSAHIASLMKSLQAK